MRVGDEKSYWKRWKKFSSGVLLKPQFGEKRSMGRTMERKIGGEKSVSRCSRGKIGGCGKREFLENFWKIFWMFFLFSPSQREPKGDHARSPLRKKWKKIKQAIRESPLQKILMFGICNTSSVGFAATFPCWGRLKMVAFTASRPQGEGWGQSHIKRSIVTYPGKLKMSIFRWNDRLWKNKDII